MKILVLGGTAWLGHAIAQMILAAGHEVTCVARGTGVPEGAVHVAADRNQDDALAPLEGTAWDVVVDVSMEPGQVRRAVRNLEPTAGRYIYISSVSAYADLDPAGSDESAELCEPLVADEMGTNENYGPAKVACEQAVLAGFGSDRSVIIRPGLIGGPGDHTGRSVYWPVRFARPSDLTGRVLVPEEPDQFTEVIDVRDLTAWIGYLINTGITGVFNAVGDPHPLEVHLELARMVAHHTGPVVRAQGTWLAAQGVGQWAGPRSLPLWVHGPEAQGINLVSNAHAKAHGLLLRPLAQTLGETLAWAQENEIATVAKAGLSDLEEQELLAQVPGISDQ